MIDKIYQKDNYENHENEKLGKLFGYSSLQKGSEKHGVGDERVAQHTIDARDDEDVQRNGNHAADEGFCKRFDGFFLVFVLTVDVNHQNDDRQDGDAEEDEIIDHTVILFRKNTVYP